MTDCVFCCEDLPDDDRMINIYADKCREESTMCKDCRQRLCESILPVLLKSIAMETCEASIKRLVKQDLPTHLSVDGTGRGKLIINAIVDGKIVCCKLQSTVNIDKLNADMRRINELAVKDDDMFLYLKNEVFEEFKDDN